MPEASHSKDRLTSAPTLLLSATRVVVFGLLAVMGIGMSAWAYDWARPDGPLFYWGILPGAPFVLLAGVSLVPRMPLRVTIGACVGGLLAVATSYGALLYASANYAGGGANIGLGLLLLATPVYLPLAMLFGAFCGRRVGSHT